MSLFPTHPDILSRLGAEAARLLTFHPGFVNRCNERLVVLDETTVRRQISLDYALPDGTPAIRQWLGDRYWYAPLLFLQKGSDARFDPSASLTEVEPHFANFDFRDSGGNPLSLPPRRWNAAVSAAMLWHVFRGAASRQRIALEADWKPAVDAFFDSVCCAEQLQAVQIVASMREPFASLQDSPEELTVLQALDQRDSTFRRLLDASSVASVLMVPLRESAARTGIVKLGFDEQLVHIERGGARTRWAGLGWQGVHVWLDRPYVGAETYHVECEAPPGLEFYEAGLFTVDQSPKSVSNTGSPVLARVSGARTRLHLYAPQAARLGPAVVSMQFRVRRREFLGGALLASCVATGVLWTAWVLRDDVKDVPASASALLLLFPSAIAAYAARADDHQLTGRMLRLARFVLRLVSVMPFLAAAAFAITKRAPISGAVTSTRYEHWWLGTAVIATLLTGVIAAGRVLPVSGVEKERLARALSVQLGPVYREPQRPPLFTRWRSR